MAFVKFNSPQVGDWVTTKREHMNSLGYFEVGTKVKVTDITERGYDIEDKYGNRVTEIGWEI